MSLIESCDKQERKFQTNIRFQEEVHNRSIRCVREREIY